MKTSIWQCKMRGKKTKALSCLCCVAVNLKDEIKEKAADKEIDQFKRGNQTLVDVSFTDDKNVC